MQQPAGYDHESSMPTTSLSVTPIAPILIATIWAAHTWATRHAKARFWSQAGLVWRLYACLMAALALGSGGTIVVILAVRGDSGVLPLVTIGLASVLVADVWFAAVSIRWRLLRSSKSHLAALIDANPEVVSRLDGVPLVGRLLRRFKAG